MRLLLDEDVPVPFVEPLRRLLPDHEVVHVEQLNWKSKDDRFLYADAKRKGYEAVLTNDKSQLDDPDECKAIKKSGLHHIRYHQETKHGLEGLAYAMSGVLAAIRPVMADLELSDSQRLVKITPVQRRIRHETVDPRKNPPPYWPRAQHKNRPRGARRSA